MATLMANEDLIYVPGLWRCAKCKFELVQATLNARDGTVSARDTPGEKCQNCSRPLWRVTEREARQEAQRECDVMWEKGRAATLHQVADFLMSDAETGGSWYELSEIIRNDRMGQVRTLSDAIREHGPSTAASEEVTKVTRVTKVTPSPTVKETE